MQHAVEDGYTLVGRNHIDAVWLRAGAILHLNHAHPGRPLKQLRHEALVGGIQVLNDYEVHAASLLDVRQKLLQRLQAPSRGADADDGEATAGPRGG